MTAYHGWPPTGWDGNLNYDIGVGPNTGPNTAGANGKWIYTDNISTSGHTYDISTSGSGNNVFFDDFNKHTHTYNGAPPCLECATKSMALLTCWQMIEQIEFDQASAGDWCSECGKELGLINGQSDIECHKDDCKRAKLIEELRPLFGSDWRPENVLDRLSRVCEEE